MKSRIHPGLLFSSRDPITCARELIGAELVWKETAPVKLWKPEAYLAENDEACHTFLTTDNPGVCRELKQARRRLHLF